MKPMIVIAILFLAGLDASFVYLGGGDVDEV